MWEVCISRFVQNRVATPIFEPHLPTWDLSIDIMLLVRFDWMDKFAEKAHYIEHLMSLQFSVKGSISSRLGF